MSGSSIDLGRLDLVSTTSGLRVELSSLLHIANPHVDDVPGEELILEPRHERLPWLYINNAFRLALDLRLALKLTAEVTGQLLDTMTSSLRDAEVNILLLMLTSALKYWQQLHLAVTWVETTVSEETGLHHINLLLTTCEGTRTHRQRVHKLGIDVPCFDVKPPVGVRIRALQDVRLAINVNCPNKRKRQIISETYDLKSYSSMRTFDRAVQYSSSASATASPTTEDENIFLSDADSTFDDILLESSSITEHSDSDSHLPPMARRVLTSSHSLAEDPFKRTCSTTGRENVMQSLGNADTVLKLVDASVRLAIAGSSKAVGKGVRVRRSKDFQCLRDIAPAIWSPGYLTAIADQAIFLPSISHAVHSVVANTERGSRVRRETKEVRETAEETSDEQQASLSVYLWRVLHTSVHGKTSARRFSPLLSAQITAMGEDGSDLELGGPSHHIGEKNLNDAAGISDLDVSEGDEDAPSEAEQFDVSDVDMIEYDADDDDWVALDSRPDEDDALVVESNRSRSLRCEENWVGNEHVERGTWLDAHDMIAI
ncbi:hypothetical protein LTR53_002597 [Teratosphaeriaceae sp. CCFEE 6253]|nr:hypothetical protein LTR53_002597 [Teratosphaeriaceae sp. CCFEE 6253]